MLEGKPSAAATAVLTILLVFGGVRTKSPPEVGPFSFAKSVALGQRALVSCTVVGGDGPFHFRWDQDGRDIGASPSKHAKTVTEHIATLTIDSVAAEDVGNYTCTVSNSAGESSFTAPLTVRDSY
ncbi:junctional adhesion molecule A-like [Amblyomma americanum]